MLFIHHVIPISLQGIFPKFVGWQLNEADSCMLGLCAHALLEDLLRSVSEFCSDFRNFSQSETIPGKLNTESLILPLLSSISILSLENTIQLLNSNYNHCFPEMLQYYQLASSNYNGMLHCTANYFGDCPSPALKEYFGRIKENITMNFENTVIGLVITPRTFGVRLKLSSEQLLLWGGDDNEKKAKDLSIIKERKAADSFRIESFEDGRDSVSSLSSALASQLIENAPEEAERSLNTTALGNTKSTVLRKKSSRYFPNCQASLVCLSSKPNVGEPDFHPVTGPGRKAHMTIGVAPGESAVTTGYDLLEIVDLEEQGREWPTYSTPRGWLRDYGEGRWVLYMNNKIFVDSMFAGVYVLPP